MSRGPSASSFHTSLLYSWVEASELVKKPRRKRRMLLTRCSTLASIFLTNFISILFASQPKCPCFDQSSFNVSCLAKSGDAQDCIIVELFNVSAESTSVHGSFRVVAVGSDRVHPVDPALLSECSISYTRGKYKVFNLETIDNEWKTTSLGTSFNFDLPHLILRSTYAIHIECSLLFDSERIHVSSETQFYRTSEKLAAPQRLEAYFSTSIYENDERTPYITVEWAPVSEWDDVPLRYHVKCVALESKCIPHCRDDFLVCQQCVTEAQKKYWWNETTVAWYKTSARILGSHPKETFVEVACSVRAISTGDMNGSWSPPKLVATGSDHSPPRLAISIVENKKAHTMLLDMSETIENATSFRVLETSTGNWPSLIEIDSCGADDPSLSEMALLDENYPLMIFTNNAAFTQIHTDPLIKDYCFNWIALVHYEIRRCKDNSTLWCIDEVDEVTVQKKTIYTATPGSVLHKIVCNPFEDFIAWSESSTSTDNAIGIMLSTPIGAEPVNILDACSEHCGYTKASISPIIALDRRTNDSISFLDSHGHIWILSHKQCSCTSYGPIKQIKENIDNIIDIAIDWWNLYWVIRDGNGVTRLQFASWTGIQGKEALKVINAQVALDPRFKNDDGVWEQILNYGQSIFTPKPLTTVTHINTAVPDMRTYLDQHLYFTTIEKVIANVSIINEKTAHVNVSIQWKTTKALQPPVRIIVRSAIINGSETIDEFCRKNKEGCITHSCSNYIRNSNYETFIDDLEENKDNIVQVIVQPMSVVRYDAREFKMAWWTNSLYRGKPMSVNAYASVKKDVAIGVSVAIVALVLAAAGTIFWLRRQPRWLLRHLPRIETCRIKLDHSSMDSGQYGRVCKGILDKRKLVAIKRLRTSANDHKRKCFLKESIILGRLHHPHIIKALGICLDARPYMLVLEYVAGGDLRHYLKKRACQFSACKLLQIGLDVAEACCYLVSKGYLHRDINADNVLVALCQDQSFDKAVLSDFGLATAQRRAATTGPYNSKTPKFPIRHAAPECFGGDYSEASDVYAFGILLWEIFTNGDTPYSHLELENIEPEVKDKQTRPKQPFGCPDNIYDVMQWCWTPLIIQRPTFKTLYTQLEVLQALHHNPSSYFRFPSRVSMTTRSFTSDVTILLESPTITPNDFNRKDSNCCPHRFLVSYCDTDKDFDKTKTQGNDSLVDGAP